MTEKYQKIRLAHHLKLYMRPDKRSGLGNPDFPAKKIINKIKQINNHGKNYWY